MILDGERLYAADIDNPGGILVHVVLDATQLCSRAQKRQALLSKGEHSLCVQGEHFSPCRVGEFVDTLSPGRARVIDEHMQSGLLRRKLLDKSFYFRVLLYVGWNGVTCPRSECC